MIRTATLEIVGVSPYSCTRFHNTPMGDKEPHEEYEKRIWREKMHVSDDGEIVIPAMAFKLGFWSSAKWRSDKLKGQKTYSKRFERGTMCTHDMRTGVHIDDVKHKWFFLPSNGQKGAGKRVQKCIPFIPQWQGKVEVMVLDEQITKDIFAKTAADFGKFVGLGYFRPENGGYWGRFAVESIKWSNG